MVPRAAVRGVRGEVLVHFRLPASGRAVGVHHRIAVGAGVRVWGPCTVPMPCGGLRAGWVVGGRPGGGWPSNPVRDVWRQALSLWWPPISGGRQPGPVARVSRARVVWLWGLQQRPHSARSWEPALRAVAVAGGASLGWGALRRCEGRLRSGARPPPADCPEGALLGSATHLLWSRVCGRGGPALSLWLACPAGGCVPRASREAVLGGLPFNVVGGFWCQTLFPSLLPVSGGAWRGPVACVSGAQVVWAWGTKHQPHSVRSCEPALRAVGVAGGRPGGGCLALF